VKTLRSYRAERNSVPIGSFDPRNGGWGNEGANDEKNVCPAHGCGKRDCMARNRTRRQRAWAVLWSIPLLLRGPVYEPHVCSGPTRTAKIQQSGAPRFSAWIARLGICFAAAVSIRDIVRRSGALGYFFGNILYPHASVSFVTFVKPIVTIARRDKMRW
jgi:hypothetical protein